MCMCKKQAPKVPPPSKKPEPKSPRAKSPKKAKTPKVKAPSAKPPSAKSPSIKSPRANSPRAKSPKPKPKSTRVKSPRAKMLHGQGKEVVKKKASSASAHSPSHRHRSASPPPPPVPDTEQESEDDYQPGGYHPMEILEVLADRYVVIRKLGWGHFSTVWLAWDTTDKSFVALKIVKSSERYAESARDEIKLLEAVRTANRWHRGHKRIVALLDSFTMTGVNGEHVVMCFEVKGKNLLNMMVERTPMRLTLPEIQVIMRQTLEGLEYLHDCCRIIHTDLKLENVVISVSNAELKQMAIQALATSQANGSLPHDAVGNIPISVREAQREFAQKERTPELEERERKMRVLMMHQLEEVKEVKDGSPGPTSMKGECNLSVAIVDLGNACWTNHHFADEIQTRQYRCPESILGLGYGPPADIWSLACVAFELATGDYLFDPHEGPNNEYNRDDDHLAMMIELIGPFPYDTYRRASHWRDFFGRNGRLLRIQKMHPMSMNGILEKHYNWSKGVARQFSAFLMPMLALDPRYRSVAARCAEHVWLQDNKPKPKPKPKNNSEHCSPPSMGSVRAT